MNLERLKSRRREITDEQRSILDTAEAQNRDLTELERRQLRQLQDEFETVHADVVRLEAERPVGSRGPIKPMPTSRRDAAMRLSPGAQGWVDAFVRARAESRAATYVGDLTVPAPIGTAFTKDERPRYLSDVVSRQSLEDTNVATWLRETAFDNNADVVPRGDTKPETEVELTRESAELQVVAHIITGIANQDLQDFTSLQTLLGVKMVEGIKLALDRLIISGDNSSFIGALDVNSNVETVAYSTDVLTTIRKTRTALLNENADPGSLAIALNPSDVEALDLLEDADQRPLFQPDGPVNANQRQVWGMTIIETPAIAAGTALAGDFERAARLFTDGNAVLQADPFRGFRVNETDLRCQLRATLGWTAPHLVRLVDLTA